MASILYKFFIHFCEIFANTDLVRCAVTNFNLERAFASTDINQKVEIFSKAFLNILSNFIPHETIIRDGKDPPWMTKGVKELI